MENLLGILSALGVPGATPEKPGNGSSSHDVQPTKTWTYRVRGVPLKWGKPELRQFLDTNDTTFAEGLEIKSLAIDIEGNRHVATVDCARSGKLPQNLTISGRLETSSASSSSLITLTCDCYFHGLTTLFCPPEADHLVDIVAVCGLGGHAFGSFKSKKDGYMWLRDSLGESVCKDDTGHPMARIMTYGYDSRLADSNSFQNISNLATALHQYLITVKPRKPMVLIGHSLGGLIIKEAVIALDRPSLGRSTSSEYSMLLRRLAGFVFFGVPHGGMDIKSLLPMVGHGPNLGMLTDICGDNSHVLKTQRTLFGSALEKIESEVFCFFETELSPTAREVDGKWEMSGPKDVLVTDLSATHYKEGERNLEHVFPMSATHSDLVKFERNEDVVVKARLSDICRRAVELRAQHVQRAEGT